MPGSDKQNSMFGPSSGYIQENNPFPVTSCGRRRNDGSPLNMRKLQRVKVELLEVQRKGLV